MLLLNQLLKLYILHVLNMIRTIKSELLFNYYTYSETCKILRKLKHVLPVNPYHFRYFSTFSQHHPTLHQGMPEVLASNTYHSRSSKAPHPRLSLNNIMLICYRPPRRYMTDRYTNNTIRILAGC